ncbi:hypothetical protein SAY86_004946 [Trapa natans]|uniref:Uncharacterized protein n=1 Tax=Trapa natans TaxID=22666 RepID=A0AAN7L4T3_TRANT|nr:hypothetical protein SAY86_004946 [Trapa natans]
MVRIRAQEPAEDGIISENTQDFAKARAGEETELVSTVHIFAAIDEMKPLALNASKTSFVQPGNFDLVGTVFYEIDQQSYKLSSAMSFPTCARSMGSGVCTEPIQENQEDSIIGTGSRDQPKARDGTLDECSHLFRLFPVSQSSSCN